jgi:hypothetical protein
MFFKIKTTLLAVFSAERHRKCRVGIALNTTKTYCNVCLSMYKLILSSHIRKSKPKYYGANLDIMENRILHGLY